MYKTVKFAGIPSTPSHPQLSDQRPQIISEEKNLIKEKKEELYELFLENL